MGIDEESRRRIPMDPQESRGAGNGAGCTRSVEAPRTHHADDGPRSQGRSDLCADLEALPREPGPVGGRVREGLVQAVAPRYGTALAVPPPLGSGAAVVAGPGASGRTCTDRRALQCRPPGNDPLVGTVTLAAGVYGVVGRGEPPRYR